MLDKHLIRNETEKVKRGVAVKGYDPGLVDTFLSVDARLRQLETELSNKRHESKQAARERDAVTGNAVKEDVQRLLEERRAAEAEVAAVLCQIPNLAFDDVEIGAGESANSVIRHWGELPQFDFDPSDHMQIASRLDMYDFDLGAKVAGSKFYFTKNEAVQLELALMMFITTKVAARGYTPMITPDLARSRYYTGTGYLPKGDEAQTYVIEGEDLGLVATAEVTLAGQFADEILPEERLPVKCLGLSHAFRREQGAYGRYSHGLYRVHQFSKAELFTFCRPDSSHDMHLEMLAIEEEIYQDLQIPYRVVEMGTGDLGAMAARKFDLEAWMPGRGDYGEITSTSNCTDFQARNLNIRFRRADGQIEHVHMVNGTALAMSRVPIAILENFQTVEGSVRLPEVLWPYIGFEEIGPRP